MSALCRDCFRRGDLGRRCPRCGSPRVIAHDELEQLSIAHMDCDAFYASVEKRDDPSLRDHAVIVGGGKRGVVTTCCYIARISGVRSAMPMFKARQLCPQAIIIKPNFTKYRTESRRIMAMVRDHNQCSRCRWTRPGWICRAPSACMAPPVETLSRLQAKIGRNRHHRLYRPGPNSSKDRLGPGQTARLLRHRLGRRAKPGDQTRGDHPRRRAGHGQVDGRRGLPLVGDLAPGPGTVQRFSATACACQTWP